MDNKILILGPTSFAQKLPEGGMVSSMVETSIWHREKPEGMIWHAILGKFVLKADAHKKMWVDREDTIFVENERGK